MTAFARLTSFPTNLRCSSPAPTKKEAAPLGSFIRRLRILSLKTRIEAAHNHCVSLEHDLESVGPPTEKEHIALEYTRTLARAHRMRAVLEFLERSEKGGINPE